MLRIDSAVVCLGSMDDNPTALAMGASGGIGAEVARDGVKAIRAKRALCLQGAFTKAMAALSRLVPCAIARRVAMRMNR